MSPRTVLRLRGRWHHARGLTRAAGRQGRSERREGRRERCPLFSRGPCDARVMSPHVLVRRALGQRWLTAPLLVQVAVSVPAPARMSTTRLQGAGTASLRKGVRSGRRLLVSKFQSYWLSTGGTAFVFLARGGEPTLTCIVPGWLKALNLVNSKWISTLTAASGSYLQVHCFASPSIGIELLKS